MPRLVLATDQVMVYDDFLPKRAFAPLLKYANDDAYAIVHSQTWAKAWHPSDGLPLIGTTTWVRDDGAYAENEHRYPTRTAVDRLVKAVHDAAGAAAPLVGRRGVDWNTFCVSPYIHPRGSGLSMHRDFGLYSGSFTFYIHQEWNLHWGGHLLVLDPRSGEGVDEDGGTFLDDGGETRRFAEPGLALCIMPKPNRFVFIRADAHHMVTRVDANAGDRARVTLSGFFFAAT
jgi:2OG-Fe(II) oxygenase superfamily